MKSQNTKIRALNILLAAMLLWSHSAWAASTDPSQADFQWRWDGVGRVVAFADVHGAYDDLIGLLQKTNVINGQLAWSGGSTHLVSLGDITDRGPDSRKVLDLLMRLQDEAAAAGGQVHVLLGNHEVMNMTGEHEETSNAEYAAFITEEPADKRAEYGEQFPPGYFGHDAAFSPNGKYGAWILQRPVVIVINEIAFAHGGMPPIIAELGAEEINKSSNRDLRAYIDAYRELLAAGVFSYGMDLAARRVAAEAAQAGPAEQTDQATGVVQPPPDPQTLQAIATYQKLETAAVLNLDGPVWYRKDAFCYPNTEYITLDAALSALNANRVVVGHTPTRNKLVTSRMDGKVFLLDAGMLKSVYKGRAAALVIEGSKLTAVYGDDTATGAVHKEQRKVGNRAGRVTDNELENILRNGEILSIEDVGEGVTKPQKIKLSKNGNEYEAIFKTESTQISSGRQKERMINNSDRWEHEVAAYRLDKLIDYRMVPVSVERTINGKTGSLSFWVDDLINLLDKNEQGVQATGYCSIKLQHDLMWVFDALIYNDDRTQQNVTYIKSTWKLVLIDHSRGFRTHRKLPVHVKDRDLDIAPELAAKLEALNSESLNAELGPYLDRSQIRAILQRRDQVLRKWAP